MPSVSKKQHNLMALVANDPKAAKRLGIPQSVGKEFMQADKGKTFKKGDNMKKMQVGGMADPRAAMMAKRKAMARRRPPMGMPPGAPAPMAPAMAPAMGPASTMKKGGRIASKGEHSVQKKSKRGAEMVKMAGGGYVKAADGVAQRGKTKGTQVKMSGGGKTKRYC